MTMGETIKHLRLESGLTQEQLGEVVGVQKSAVRKWECGAVENIKQQHLQAMAEFFQVSQPFLMGFEPVKIDDNIGILTYDENILLDLYRQLDIEGKSEIRGEIKGMLKSRKSSN